MIGTPTSPDSVANGVPLAIIASVSVYLPALIAPCCTS
jgi:hypothetical protein